VTLVLTRIASVRALLRLWGIVIITNVLGAVLGTFVLANTGVFTPAAAAVAHGSGEHAFATARWKPSSLSYRQMESRQRRARSYVSTRNRTSISSGPMTEIPSFVSVTVN
jgi:hypothetical protein